MHVERPDLTYPNALLGAQPEPQAERPVGEIVTDLWHNTEKLVRQEIELGLAEIDDRVDYLKRELMLKVTGGVLLLGGYLAMLAAVILLLSKAIDPWLSALIVGAALLGLGYLFEQRLKPREHQEASTSYTHKLIDQGRSLKEAMK
jgi:hypothetical protein